MESRWNLVLLGIAVLGLGLYLPTLAYDLVWDDRFLLDLLERSNRAGGIPGLLGAEFRLYQEQDPMYYRPVVMLSLWFDRLLSGALPYSFHLTNVVLHSAVSALVASAGRLLTGSPAAGLLAGLLFAVHPSHVESVAFVSGRTDLLAALFGALSLMCWLRDRSGLPPRLLPWSAWGGAAYLLSCLSKEVGVLLPAVLLSWDAIFPAGEPPDGNWWSRNRRWCASWGLSLAALLTLRWGVAGLPPLPGGSYAGSHVERALRDLSLLPSMWLEYLRMLVIPWPPRIAYTSDQLGLSAWTATGTLGFGGLAWASSSAASRRAGLWGVLWIFAFLLPVSGVVPLQGAIVAERFLYVPSVGFCVMAGAAASRIPDRLRLPRPALAVAAVGVAALLSAGVLSASRYWKDEGTLFARMIRTTPGGWVGYYNLARLLDAEGRSEEAIVNYRMVIRLRPDFPIAQYNLAVLLARAGNVEEAIICYRNAIRLNPRLSEARNNLGVLLEGANMPDEAMAQYREALRVRPDDPFAHKNLGNLLARRGQFAEAAAHYRETLRKTPDDVQAHYNLGICLKATGEGAEADAHLAEAVRLRKSRGDIGSGRR